MYVCTIHRSQSREVEGTDSVALVSAEGCCAERTEADWTKLGCGTILVLMLQKLWAGN